MNTTIRSKRRGFSIPDALALGVVLAVAAALAVILLPRSRTLGHLSNSLANLRELGSAIHTYGLDNADRVATFSWRRGDTSSQFPDLKNPIDDLQAAGYQAADIIRRRTPMTMAEFPRQTSWLASVRYSHLVLLDYLDQGAPWTRTISPADAQQLKWATDPKNWMALGAPNVRQPFAGSYEMPPAWWSPDAVNTVTQSTAHNMFNVPNGVELGRRTLAECAFPSNKALMYEWAGRYTGPRVAFFMYDEARNPVLTADGSAALRAGRSINDGWEPNSPTSPFSTVTQYSPQLWEPPILSGTSTQVKCGMRFTRMGLGGRDVDGAEIPYP